MEEATGMVMWRTMTFERVEVLYFIRECVSLIRIRCKDWGEARHRGLYKYCETSVVFAVPLVRDTNFVACISHS